MSTQTQYIEKQYTANQQVQHNIWQYSSPCVCT
jgi:hypothetical protein